METRQEPRPILAAMTRNPDRINRIYGGTRGNNWRIGHLCVWVSRIVRLMSLLTVVALGAGSISTRAQETTQVQGDFIGSLGPLHLQLHVTVAPDGSLTGTLDSLDQGAMGLPCTDFHRDGRILSFSVPVVHGSWNGSVENDGATLAGTWNQGSPMPLTFTKDRFVPAAKPSMVDGIWLGKLRAGARSLRIQIVLNSDNIGQEFCHLDSIDQGAFNLACSNVEYANGKLSFDIPAVHGHWTGKVSSNHNSLAGTWNQGVPLPLNLVRQSTPWAPPPVTHNAAIPPVDAANMQSVLSSDLEQAFSSGALAPGTSAGLTIGIVHKSVRRVFAYGTAKPDSIFEIGSITKTFTGLILSQMVEQGVVKIDEPVRLLLPVGVVATPRGLDISLLDLITQHSGLPRLPDNLKPADPDNPYADYHAANLYAFLSVHGLEKVGDPPFLYSNLGVGLLGQALANRAGVPYPTLLFDQVTGPLVMKDTVIALSVDQQHRLIEGHTADHRVAHAWDLDALAGAGAVRSTADDMLTYLEAQLHPERIVSEGSESPSKAQTIAAAITLSHELRADAGPGTQIAFAWLYNTATGSYRHNGATGGYSSFAFFNPMGDYAAVVLMNTTTGAQGSFADLVGQHINQRFTGSPAVSLGN